MYTYEHRLYLFTIETKHADNAGTDNTDTNCRSSRSMLTGRGFYDDCYLSTLACDCSLPTLNCQLPTLAADALTRRLLGSKPGNRPMESCVSVDAFNSPCARPNIGTKHVNRFHYDFPLARYLKCPKMVDGQFFHIAKCHFGGHL